MEKKEKELIASLIDRDAELKQYYEEHLELESQLDAFQRKAYLSTEEELERKRLQKKKLVGKDRIMEILGKYRQD